MNRCPKCKGSTASVHYEGVGVKMCGQCGGYWVSPTALKAIANRRETEFNEAVKERFLQLAEQSNTTEALLCVSCGKYMIKESFKDWDDIVIDRCPTCGGIWLDAGELEKIQIYWEYFQDHPEESNIDAIARRALLEADLQQRRRDIAEASEELRQAARHRGRVAPAMLGRALQLLLGR
jgi:Zn-finger nucleic acid-binding protein